MRYFLKFGYDGALYHGFQRQPGDISVQEVIEDALRTVIRQEIPIVGAGRTDTGVNARVMYAHFDVAGLEDSGKFLKSLNRILGSSIVVYDVLRVTDDAHARFDATERTYKYFISGEKNPFVHGHQWECYYQLDCEEMNRAAKLLTEVSDFTSFAKLHSDAKTNICRVTRAIWERFRPFGALDDRGLVFTISADRFLRNMVRAVVGTLVDVGRGKISVEDVSRIIEAHDRCAAGASVPPEGLYLWDVKYNREIFI